MTPAVYGLPGGSKRYKDYTFFVDFADGIGRDRVSGTVMDTRLDTGRVNTDGTALGLNVPAIQGGKLNTFGAVTNVLPYSYDFTKWSLQVAQGVSLDSLGDNVYRINFGQVGYGPNLASVGAFPSGTVSTRSVWLKSENGPGTVKIDDPVGYTVCSKTVTVTNEWQLFSTTGTLSAIKTIGLWIRAASGGLTSVLCKHAQVTPAPYLLPYVPTNGAAITTPHGYSDSDEGYKWAFDRCPKLYTSLNGTDGTNAQGTLEVDWTPMFDSAVFPIDSPNVAILSQKNSQYSCLSMASTTVKRLVSSDGTIVTQVTAPWLAGVKYNIKVRYGPHPEYAYVSKMRIIITDGTTIWEPGIVDFDGSFNPLTHLSISWLNTYWQQISSIKVKEANPWIDPTAFNFEVINSQVVAGVISTTTDQSLTIFWGDGTSTVVSGTDRAYSHDYGSIVTMKPYITNPQCMTKFTMASGGTNIKFDIKDLPAGLLYLLCGGASTTTGNLSSLPSGLTYFYLTGLTTVTGNLSDLPTGLTAFNCTGLNTLYGDLSSLPAGLLTFTCTGSNTTTGNLSNLPPGLLLINYAGRNTVAEYSGKVWPSGIRQVIFSPFAPGGLSTAEVNQLLTDLALVATWGTEKIVKLTGTNAPRSSESDAAVATLVSKGVTLTLNS